MTIIIVIFAKIMTIIITIIVTIMKIQKIQKVIIVIVVIVAIMIITKILVMINSARSYDWSCVLLSQAFLNIIIIIISKWSCSV